LLALAALLAAPAWAQDTTAPPNTENKEKDQSGGREWKKGKRGGDGSRRGRGHHAGDWLRRYKDLPPAEQDRALAADPQFQKLPPERQERLRRRLEKFRGLPPEQQQRILQNMERFEHMTPEQRRRARELHFRMRQLPEERRQALRRAFGSLRDLPAEERAKALDSERFRQNFSDEEREMLRTMSEIEPPPGEPPPAPQD
jgi:hypothetical protein